MTWISTIPYDAAQGRLAALYDRVKGPNNNVDNVMMAHSLRPHTMEGHMTLYKYVLHHPANALPKWFLETLGVYVSLLNKCAYCVEHHFAGLTRLVEDRARSDQIRHVLERNDLNEVFSKKEVGALEYAFSLTRDPGSIDQKDIERLRSYGLTDGEILEVNQVVAYFCYANRTVLGLGVNQEGDILGLSPNNSSDPDDWGHQ